MVDQRGPPCRVLRGSSSRRARRSRRARADRCPPAPIVPAYGGDGTGRATVELCDNDLEIAAKPGIEPIVGLDRRAAPRQDGLTKIVTVGHRMPALDVFEQLRHCRQLLDQHHDLVEQVQVIVGEPRCRVDERFGAANALAAERSVWIAASSSSERMLISMLDEISLLLSSEQVKISLMLPFKVQKSTCTRTGLAEGR